MRACFRRSGEMRPVGMLPTDRGEVHLRRTLSGVGQMRIRCDPLQEPATHPDLVWVAGRGLILASSTLSFVGARTVMMAIPLGFFVGCLPPFTAKSGVRVGVVVALIIVNAPRMDRGSSILSSVRLVLGESRSSEYGTECGEDKKPFHGHSEPSPYRSNDVTQLRPRGRQSQ